MINEVSRVLLEYLHRKEINLIDVREFLYRISPIMKLTNIYFISNDTDKEIRVSKFSFDPLDFGYINIEVSIEEIETLIYDIDHQLENQMIKKEFFPYSEYIAFYIFRQNSKYFCLIEINDSNIDFIVANIEWIKVVFKSIMDKSVTTQFHSFGNFSHDLKSGNTIIDKISQVILISDLDTNEIVHANRFAQKLFNRQLIGEKCYKVLFGSNSPCKNCYHRDFNGDNLKKNYHHADLDKYFDIYYQFIENNDGKRYRIETAFDITTNETIRQELIQKLEMVELQQKALDKTAIVVIRDSMNKVIYANQKFYDTYKYSNREVIGKTFVNPGAFEPYLAEIEQSLKRGKSWRGELLTYDKHEAVVWLDTTILPFIVKSELQIVSISYDITASKRKDIEIRRLARAVEQSPTTIVITDAEGNIQFVNPKFTKTTGYTQEEVIGKNPRILKSGDMASSEYTKLWETISNGNIWRGFFHNKKKNGELFWEEASIAPVLDESGKIINYIASKEDVTFKKQIESALSHSVALIGTILESINEGIIAFDVNGNYVSVNSIFLSLWNLRENVINGLTEQEIFQLFEGAIVDIMQYKNILDTVYNNPTVSYFDKIELISGDIYELTVKPLIQDDKYSGRLWSFRNVTQAVRSEEKLRFYMQNLEKSISESETQAEFLAKTVSELELAKEKAEAGAKAKSEFIANISHEIRTPLNAVIGFTELMREEEISTRQKEYLDSISNSGKNLLRLINDILDLSKIESGKLELQFEPITVRNLFAEVFAIFKHRVDSKKVQFTLNISDKVPERVFLDEVRLRQILFNLIGNAVKFTDNGFINIVLNSLANSNDADYVDLEIIVSDSGIGISKQMQLHIFDAFTQQSGQSNRKYEGTGLGLAITKKLTEMIGGSISLESEYEAGAKFTVNLENIKICRKDIQPKATAINTINEIEFMPATILAADDIEANVKLIQGLLRNQPLEIVTIDNGYDAIDLAKELLPDLILMDYKMPRMNGVDAAKAIRMLKLDKNIKIVILTAASLSKSETEKLKEVFDDFLIKPFNRVELYDLLAKYLPSKYKENIVNVNNFEENEQCYLNIESISSDEISNAQNVIYELSGDIMEKWDKAKKLSIVDGIKEFALSILSIASENQLDTLIRYANKLHQEAVNFDFENFPNTMKMFPDIIDKYKQNVS